MDEEHPLGLGEPYLEGTSLPDGGMEVSLPTEAEWVKRGGKVAKSVAPKRDYVPVDDWEDRLHRAIERIWDKATTSKQENQINRLYEATFRVLESLEQMPDLVELREEKPLSVDAVKTMLGGRLSREQHKGGWAAAVASVLVRGKLLEIREGAITTVEFK